MASIDQYAFPGQPPRYEQLKEEQELRSPVSTVVQMQQQQQVYVPPTRDHFVWSLFTTLYLNFCCLGLLALNFSIKARDRKVLGDPSGAISYGSTAKYLNITALVLSVLMIIMIIIVTVTGSLNWV